MFKLMPKHEAPTIERKISLFMPTIAELDKLSSCCDACGVSVSEGVRQMLTYADASGHFTPGKLPRVKRYGDTNVSGRRFAVTMESLSDKEDVFKYASAWGLSVNQYVIAAIRFAMEESDYV